MGMIGYVRQVTPFELASFRQAPSKIKEMLDAETLSAFTPGAQAAIQRLEEMSWLRRLFRSREMERLEHQLKQEMDRPEASSLLAAQRARDELKVLRLDKEWPVLHYLLTGVEWEAPPPLGNAILGGTSIGPDVGYGPARFLTPAEVRETAAALAEITNEDLARRFDPAVMAKANIYPTGFGDEAFEDILYYFEKLVAYYREASEAGNAMLLYIQ